MMEVKIDDNAGFCFGVVKAIATAEDELAHSESLYCLGDIVHNSAEVDRLRKKGLKVINYEEMKSVRNAKVLIRAHGEPPSTYEMAHQQGIELVDATCPMVLALQKKIKKGYEKMKLCGGTVVIFGKEGHAEVVGLNGQADGQAIIVSKIEDIENVNFDKPIRLYSQTTKSRKDYEHLIEVMRVRAKSDFVAYNTLCSRVANRAKELEDFASSVDVVLFVSGSNSSNGKYLYEYCKDVQPETYLLTDDGKSQLNRSWIEGKNRIGITGATSTPRWLMEQLKDEIRNS